MALKNYKGSAILALAAFIWGCAFVAQSAGMDHVGPFTFNAVRNFIGCLVLLPCIALLDKIGGKRPTIWGSAKDKKQRVTLLQGGVCAGVILAAASALQQMGIIYTSVAKAGFITTLYIVFVPLLGLFIGKKVGKLVWLGVVLAAVGLYFLCITQGLTLNFGDTLVFGCAITFSLHILTIDYFSRRTDAVRMAFIQFFVAGTVSLVMALIFESISLQNIMGALVPLLYTGVLSSGVAFTLQIVGQKYTAPTVASLIMSFEAVFAALAGWILLGEIMTQREVFGALLLFVAIILAQLPQKQRAHK